MNHIHATVEGTAASFHNCSSCLRLSSIWLTLGAHGGRLVPPVNHKGSCQCTNLRSQNATARRGTTVVICGTDHTISDARWDQQAEAPRSRRKNEAPGVSPEKSLSPLRSRNAATDHQTRQTTRRDATSRRGTTVVTCGRDHPILDAKWDHEVEVSHVQ